ncbi:MAG: adenosine kinase [Thermodesulfobacteriota bacterium]
MIEGNKKRITGVGSALVDLLAREEDAFLEMLGGAKGGMTLVESEFIERAIERASQKPSIVSGGSACNTVAGIGMLGGEARFIGVLGQDSFGELFHYDLKQSNVEPVLARSASPTGKVLSVITPDAQRTMFTCLGASTELDPAAMTRQTFERCAIVVVEGYLLFNPALMLATVRAAKEAGALVSLDLASFDVVHQSRSLLKTIVTDYVDILIANEDEARAYTGQTDPLTALEGLSENVTIAALKVGALGSYLSRSGEVVRVQPQTGCTAVDTTGAGDLWAAGFLYGLVNGYSLDRCGALGSACGYEVCQVIGAKIPNAGWERIRTLLY